MLDDESDTVIFFISLKITDFEAKKQIKKNLFFWHIDFVGCIGVSLLFVIEFFSILNKLKKIYLKINISLFSLFVNYSSILV